MSELIISETLNFFGVYALGNPQVHPLQSFLAETGGQLPSGWFCGIIYFEQNVKGLESEAIPLIIYFFNAVPNFEDWTSALQTDYSAVFEVAKLKGYQSFRIVQTTEATAFVAT